MPDDVLVVGPSTVEVRSTPHAATPITTASELDRKRNLFFMAVVMGIGQRAVGRYLSTYTIVPGPTLSVRAMDKLKSLQASAERLPGSFTKLATVDVESTASFCSSRTKVVARLRQFVLRLRHCC